MSGISSQRAAQLDDIVTRSEAMLRLAEQGDWEALPAAETERRSRIEAFFALAPSGEEAADIDRQLRRVLAIDHRILVLSDASRKELSGKMNELQRGRRAQHAYQSQQLHRSAP